MHPEECPEDLRRTLLEIAETRELPEGADFDAKNRLVSGGYVIDVWWVDLRVPFGDSFWDFRIRDRKVRSRPLTEKEKYDMERIRIWEKTGQLPPPFEN